MRVGGCDTRCCDVMCCAVMGVFFARVVVMVGGRGVVR